MERVLAVSLALFLCFQPIAGAVVPASANGEVTLTVSVRTPIDEPVGGADLYVTWDGGSKNETTAANGKAFVDVPEGANVSIEVNHSRYVRNTPAEITDATSGEVDVTVYPKASLMLDVVDPNGAPVPNARVRLFKRGQLAVNATTDAEGTVSTGVIESGEYRVRLGKPGFLTREFTRRTTDRPWNLTIERDSVAVTFSARDGHFSPPRPIVNATIEGPSIGSVRTTEDGRRTMSVPVNMGFEVTVRKPGYENVTRRISVAERPVRINVTIERTPVIRVRPLSDRVVVGERVLIRATNAYREPVAEGVVFLGNERVATTDDDGEAIVRIESVGAQMVQVRADGLGSDPVTITGVKARTPTATPTATVTPTATTTPTGTASPTPTAVETTERATPTAGPDNGFPSTPGFGITAAILAVLVALPLLRRRA